MFADDFLPSFIARLGVIVIHPDVVAAERAVIVRIGLPVGDIIKFPEPFPPAGSKDPRQQFVTSRIVILRLGEGNTIIRVVAHADPETISLYPFVCRSEERRVGKERVSRWRTRWSPYT